MRYLVAGFDYVLKALLFYFCYHSALKAKLIDEAGIFRGIKDKYSNIDHFAQLLTINHTRVSASISHASLMLGALLVSYNLIFSDHRYYRSIVAAEIVAYLAVTAALLRCVRDFGLDWPLRKVDAYEAALLDEIAFRFAILRVSNMALILLAVLYFALLCSFFWTTTWWASSVKPLAAAFAE